MTTMDGQHFSSRAGFVLAAIGSAVGLGSIWKFPYEVGENGGAAFLVFYVGGLVLVVVPLLLAEFVVGRRGGNDVVQCITAAAREDGRSPAWGLAGVLALSGGFLLTTYYAVIAGMTMDYAVRAAIVGFRGADTAQAQAAYDALVGDPLRLAAWQSAFLALTVAVVARGVARGIEAACMVLMPLLALCMAALVVYAAIAGDLVAAAGFLFAPRLEDFGARAALEALGLGFFSIGVGFGAMATYAAYTGRDVHLGAAAVTIIVGDTLVSVLAGLAVFPLVFAYGLDPASGTGLVFVTLPIAFGRLPGGDVVAAGFFFLLFVAALASTLSLVELVVAPLRRWTAWSRGRTAVVAGFAIWAGGIPTVLSFNVLREARPLAWVPTLAGMDVYGLVDGLTSNILLPLGGVLFAAVVGGGMPAARIAEALGCTPAAASRLQAILRWPVPAIILLLVVAGFVLP
ncbi:MAG: sodium-dependent transporter [Alphaproteobacteria bacterium]|nr:sodium-dependent transporter [Alphaproteobacteria bacterium]